jgi:hypothetical protein
VVISVGWESTVTWVWPAVVNAGSERGVVVKDYRITRNEPLEGAEEGTSRTPESPERLKAGAGTPVRQ